MRTAFFLNTTSQIVTFKKKRPGVVDLPKEQFVANHRAITLSEDWKTAGQLEIALPEISDDFLLEEVPEIQFEEGLAEEDFRNIGESNFNFFAPKKN